MRNQNLDKLSAAAFINITLSFYLPYSFVYLTILFYIRSCYYCLRLLSHGKD